MRTLALVLLVACGSSRKAEPVRAIAGDLVFADVTVVPMDRDTTVPHQTVIVRGDKIVAIAPHDRREGHPGEADLQPAGQPVVRAPLVAVLAERDVRDEAHRAEEDHERAAAIRDER